MKRIVVSALLYIFITHVFAQVPKITPFGEQHRQRIEEVYRYLDDKPSGFGHPWQNREMWEEVRKTVDYDGLIKDAETIAGTPMPPWNDSLYLEFSRNGLRPPGERMISQRKSRLRPLVWAECLENKGRFIPAIEHTLQEVIAHKSWVLPAHDRQLAVFYGKKHEVDLVAALFAHELALSLYYLDDKISTPIRKAVIDSLYTRVFDPVSDALERGEGYTFNWLNVTNNWNAVCLAGVTGAASTIITDRKERAVFLAAAEYYSQNSMVGYTDDGYCSEGLGYYNYGFENYIVLREVLYQSTKGNIDLFNNQKIANIARYGVNFEIINQVYPAFADCRIGTQTSPFILWYCNRNLNMGLPEYTEYRPGRFPSTIMAGLLFFPNTASLSPIPDVTKKSSGQVAPRTFFEDAGVLIARPEKQSASAIGVALKGGHNAEHHNHNDIGSYVIVVGDETLAGDPGGPYHYAGDMWTDKRYTFKSISSFGHPVPRINDMGQEPGKDAQGIITHTNFSGTRDKLVLDMAKAYKIPGLQKLERHFTYNRTGATSFIVEDYFTLEEPGTFETVITTLQDWNLKENGIIQMNGKENQLSVRIQVPDGMTYTVTSEDIQENGPRFSRIAVRLNEEKAEGFIRLTFEVL